MREFNVSINIIRDQDSELDYIITKNAADNFDLIASNFRQNNRFQAIIGSYGTGKSSFLWAFEQNLLGKKNYFNSIANSYPNVKSFEFIKLIGEYKSLSYSLAATLKIDPTIANIEEEVIRKLDEIVINNSKKKIVTVLLLDEFGKFLEYAVKNNPDKEVYYIQQLAEFFNNPKKLALAVSSLHQNFSSYGQSLSIEQFKEWEKVKGRLKEVAFNEPIDQLLYFASKRNLFEGIKLKDKNLKLFKLILNHTVSDKKHIIDSDLAEKLLPLDYISAEIMAKSLQRYGQNERSLFTFLDVNENFSFKWFYEESFKSRQYPSVYNLNTVFDYIIEHYYFVIASNSNLDLTNWNSIKSALDQVDTRLANEYIVGGRQVVKTIGLLNIFTHAGANINEEFITAYSELALGIENAKEVINQLINQKIISYKKFKHRFVFVDWTDLNIDFELQKASQKVLDIQNISERISELNEFHPILVKGEYFRTGTPRLFEYKFTNSPIIEMPEDSDAIINYVFSEKEIVINNVKQPVLYAYFANSNKIKSLFFEIDKARKVIEENRNDRSAIKELNERIFYNIQDLKELLVDDIYSNDSVEWFYLGEKIDICNRLSFNRMLNEILSDNFSQSPIFKSELVNKSKISTPISLARKNLITHLIENREKENIGFEKEKFPPEKTIYLSLIKATGIHRFNNETELFELGEPDFNQDNYIIKSYKSLWKTSVDFLEKSKKGKLSVKSFSESLLNPPLKLKHGFIDFWIPLFLITKKDEYALFNETGYIPNIDTQVFDVMYKSPQKFFVKAFDVSGVKLEVFNKYKTILNQSKTNLPSEKDFINTIKPFILFVRSLPEYSINTNNITQQSIDLRQAIINAKDPEKAFFEDFPKALNYSEALQSGDNKMLEGFVEKMESSIMEIRSSYDNLVDRFESHLISTLKTKNKDFESYQKLLKKSLKSIDSNFLNGKLRNLKNNCIAPKTERKAFLEGIAFAVLSKPLSKIRDHEESILHKEFATNYKRLLDLVKVHELKTLNIDSEVYGINIIDAEGKEIQGNVIIDSDKLEALNNEVTKIKSNFNGIDNDLKRAILIKLLKEEVK